MYTLPYGKNSPVKSEVAGGERHVVWGPGFHEQHARASFKNSALGQGASLVQNALIPGPCLLRLIHLWAPLTGHTNALGGPGLPITLPVKRLSWSRVTNQRNPSLIKVKTLPRQPQYIPLSPIHPRRNQFDAFVDTSLHFHCTWFLKEEYVSIEVGPVYNQCKLKPTCKAP